jgi:hypothetical protein
LNSEAVPKKGHSKTYFSFENIDFLLPAPWNPFRADSGTQAGARTERPGRHLGWRPSRIQRWRRLWPSPEKLNSEAALTKLIQTDFSKVHHFCSRRSEASASQGEVEQTLKEVKASTRTLWTRDALPQASFPQDRSRVGGDGAGRVKDHQSTAPAFPQPWVC